jgi:hypothetical protein
MPVAARRFDHVPARVGAHVPAAYNSDIWQAWRKGAFVKAGRTGSIAKSPSDRPDSYAANSWPGEMLTYSGELFSAGSCRHGIGVLDLPFNGGLIRAERRC